jgi:hypothetical protein
MGCDKCKLLFIFTMTNWTEIGLEGGEKVWNHALRTCMLTRNSHVLYKVYICKGKIMIPRRGKSKTQCLHPCSGSCWLPLSILIHESAMFVCALANSAFCLLA